MFYLIDTHYMVPYGGPKKCIILHYRPNYWLCLQSARYKLCNLTSFIRLRRKIKNINNISLKFIMLTNNNQIFRNWFVIIHRHRTKVSAQIIQCIIFERNELSITIYSKVPFPRKCENLGIKIARFNLILITKSINLL